MAPSHWHRTLQTVAIVLTTAAMAAFSTSCGSGERGSAAYCAFLPDSIGLYPGNPVTAKGYRIGNVKSLTPSASNVRVDFTVADNRRLPSDIKAVIRSPSILADRSLELVGDLDSDRSLPPGGCIPIERSATPKSLSEVIGSATTFINSISPNGSTNVGGVVHAVDAAMHNQGVGINQLLTTSSAILDSPDQAVSDIGSILANLAHLTSTLTELRGPLKEIMLDAQKTTPDIVQGVNGSWSISDGTVPLVQIVEDIELHLGDELQLTLDSTSLALRKLSPHAPRLANLLNPVPWWINSLSNIINNHPWQTIRYRPPLYRIRTPDGVALCNVMNASMQGSCANVQGTPYAVDVALLQYVLAEAAKR